MLRFILYLLEEFIRFKHFNTSHVTVYLAGKQNNNGVFMNFNTSHVTVYPKSCIPSLNICIEFQYIPCYGLSHSRFYRSVYAVISIHPMLRFIFHRWSMVQNKHKFQYIPCYGLSILGEDYFVRNSEFQYIPCYGLSNDFKPFLSWHLSSFPLFYVISGFFTSRL